MTVSTFAAPASFDYTSRDYASIFNDLLNLKTQFIPEWTSTSQNDFGIVLLQLFSYVGDSLHYYLDRIANEAFLDTATQKASVIRIARMLGYTPRFATAASVSLLLTNATSNAITVPALTTVVTSANNVSESPVSFETDVDVVVPANGSATVSATEGQTISNEILGYSDATISQSFALANTSVIQGSVSVYVDEGNGPVEWSYVARLLTAGPLDRVYTLSVDENDVVTVEFGDGANGKIPGPLHAPITATYRIGGGLRGNVPIGSLTLITSAVPAGISVSNPNAATGGLDEESLDSIRDNAARVFTTLQRCVTLDDYGSMAVSVSSVGKASVFSQSMTSVTVYVAPDGGGQPTSALQATILNTLSAAAPANTSITIGTPSYVGVDITLTANVLASYRQSSVQDAVNAAIDDLFAFDNVVFGDFITIGDVISTVNAVDGVSWCDVSTMARSGGSGTAPIQFGINEIPMLGTVTLTMAGGIN